jgi:hypothetical protein
MRGFEQHKVYDMSPESSTLDVRGGATLALFHDETASPSSNRLASDSAS